MWKTIAARIAGEDNKVYINILNSFLEAYSLPELKVPDYVAKLVQKASPSEKPIRKTHSTPIHSQAIPIVDTSIDNMSADDSNNKSEESNPALEQTVISKNSHNSHLTEEVDEIDTSYSESESEKITPRKVNNHPAYEQEAEYEASQSESEVDVDIINSQQVSTPKQKILTPPSSLSQSKKSTTANTGGEEGSKPQRKKKIKTKASSKNQSASSSASGVSGRSSRSSTKLNQ